MLVSVIVSLLLSRHLLRVSCVTETLTTIQVDTVKRLRLRYLCPIIADVQHPGSGCFNPRPRARGDKVYVHAPTLVFPFQSSPPCKGRPQELINDLLGKEFQSSPPCKGRRWQRGYLYVLQCFNPRPRARGDLIPRPALCPYLKFQSSPPCKGRHDVRPLHTPADVRYRRIDQ